MAGDEILSNKMADANRRMEEEEADARKPYYAMMDRNRELAAQDAAKIEARDVALFTIAGSVKAMNTSFSEREIEVLRFSRRNFLRRARGPKECGTRPTPSTTKT